MKKTAFKTFVYSFVISTLVIFSINRLPSCFPQKNPQTSKIKYKNITSFVKEESKNLVVDIPSFENNDSNGFLDNEEDIAYNIDSDINSNVEIEDLFFEQEQSSSYHYDIATSFSDIDDDAVEASGLQYVENQDTPITTMDESSWKIAGFDSFAATEQEVSKEESVASALEEDRKIKDNVASSLIPIQKNNTDTQFDNVLITDSAPSNQVAMSQSEASLRSLKTEDKPIEIIEKQSANNPWVVAKGIKFPSNNMIVELSNSEESKVIGSTFNVAPKTTAGEVKVAEMVRNILIPIPEDILKEGNLTPQLISSKRNKDLQDRIEQNIREKKVAEEALLGDKEDQQKTEAPSVDAEENDADKKDKKTIFDSISSIFSGKAPAIGVSKNNNEQKFDTVSSVYAIKKGGKSKKDAKVTKILPTEIKLSFQPNRAEISGQTLKWIEAFANKTIEDGSVVLEIRIDGTTSFELQQKRLSLLHNILTNKGVEYKKINTVFTTREPNSFIIRTVRVDDKSVAMDGNPKIKQDSNYYQYW